MHFRNQEIKNLFKTLKENALQYKQKNKLKINELKKQISSYQKNRNYDSENDTIAQSRFIEESSNNINEIMRQSREKENDYTSQIKSKSKQVDELKNTIIHYKSL